MSAACDACVPSVAGKRFGVKGELVYKEGGVQWQPPIFFTQQTQPSPLPPLFSVIIIMPASRNTVATAVASSSRVSNDPNAISNNPLRRGEIQANLEAFQRSFNRPKFRQAHGSRSRPYPEVQDIFIRLGAYSLGNDVFGDLFLADTITATKCHGCNILRRNHEGEVGPLLQSLLERGLQHSMDVDEAGDGSWFQYSIGYASSVGIGLLEEIRKTNDQVSRVLVVLSYLN